MLTRRTSFNKGVATRAAKGAILVVGLTEWKTVATEQGVRVICHSDLQDRRAVSHRTLKWIGDTFQKEDALASA